MWMLIRSGTTSSPDRMKRKSKCYARGQSVHWCDGCKTTSTKCPYRDKFRILRKTKKGYELYPQLKEIQNYDVT